MNDRYWVCYHTIMAKMSPLRLAFQERLSKRLNIRITIKDLPGNIEKYYCQLVLLKLKLIVIKISIYKVTDNTPGLGTIFPIQTYEKIFIEPNHVL